MTIYKIRPIAILLIFIFIGINSSFAQKRMAVFGMQSRGGDFSVKAVPEKIISYFSGDDQFIIIDRKNENLINEEMRLQKSESFIDGYIVEQGKAEGADLICSSIYDAKSKEITIKITDVATAETICIKQRKLKSGWLSGLKNLDQEVTIMLHEIATDCFEKSFPVVRMLDSKKNKAKELLILGGYSQKIKLDYRFEIVQSVEEKIGDLTKMRKTAIGTGYINKIEDENFSILKVEDGKKEIYEALESGQTLECRLINDKK